MIFYTREELIRLLLKKQSFCFGPEEIQVRLDRCEVGYYMQLWPHQHAAVKTRERPWRQFPITDEGMVELIRKHTNKVHDERISVSGVWPTTSNLTKAGLADVLFDLQNLLLPTPCNVNIKGTKYVII